jgi:soluble P-type ATPase
VIHVSVPGRAHVSIEYLILDLNGTIALDGKLIPGVKERVVALSRNVTILVVTADTNKNAEGLLRDLPVTLYRIEEAQEDEHKGRLVRERGKDVTVSMGNGCNDVTMLREAAIGVCVVGGEGASTEALMASDLVAPSINDALDLFLKPNRLKASLRR